MIALDGIEPQHPRERLEHVARRVHRAALFDPRVPTDRHARERRDLLATEAGGAAPFARREADILRSERGAPSTEELGEIGSAAHARHCGHHPPARAAEGGGGSPTIGPPLVPLPDAASTARMDRVATVPPPLLPLSLRARTARSSMIRDLLHVLEQPHVLSLAGGLPAATAMPTERLRLALERALDEQGRYGPVALQYGPTEGAPSLRDLVASAAHAEDGRTTVDGVLTTTGSQQALDLLARVLVDPGDAIVVEHPAYLGSLQAFSAAGARFVEIPSDRDGMQTDVLERQLQAGLRPKACAVVPNFHNPTGATLAAHRREHLASLAERYGFVVIEDDPYHALRFGGDDLAPIRVHSELVVTLGSSSKVLAPGLRVGWLAGPAALVRHLVRAKQSVDLHTPMLNQLAVADVLGDDAFMATHLRGLRATYAERCDALAHALVEELGRRIELTKPDGGFFVWARLPGTDTGALLHDALDEGVAFVPGAEFTTHEGELTDRMRLSFASLDADALAEAARRMAAAYSRRHADHGRPRGGQRTAAHEPRPTHRARG